MNDDEVAQLQEDLEMMSREIECLVGTEDSEEQKRLAKIRTIENEYRKKLASAGENNLNLDVIL